MLRLLFVVSLAVLCAGVDAEDTCYTPGSVAGIVIATVVVTIVMGGLAAAVIWYLWKQRKVVCMDGEKQNCAKSISCPPMSPDKKPIVRDMNDYAFDNPYFKDDEVDGTTPDAAEKGESGFHGENGDAQGTQNGKQNGQKAKKNRPFSNLPFHAVFHPSGKKQRATMDDTYISKHLERVVVPLRGHDFTGLGFNICGNMRDGIFVKDVLHRGPASESGKIKSGDRIVGVTVSFGAMVYEDALTILSYSSPYDVKLEIEKPLEPPTASPKRLAPPSTSFRGGNQRNRLFHPLYRSQSIDDLTQIGKESFLAGSQSTGSQRESSSSTPKRSQSIEAGASKSRAAFPIKVQDDLSTKPQPEVSKESQKSSASSQESGNKIVDDKTQQAAALKEDCKKVEPKSSRFKVEQTPTKTEAPVLTLPPVKPSRDNNTHSTIELPPRPQTDGKEPVEPQKTKTLEVEDSNGEVPTAPPRKMSTPKRRAPAPPPAPKTEAVVHRVDEKAPDSTEAEPPALPPKVEPVSIPVETETKDIASSGTSQSSLDSGQSKEEEEPSSPGKRKASSLGDLTKLEQGANKSSTVSSAVLERAVSLDLQQSLPGDNLMKQKKILRAPTFEDYDEGREDDHSAEGTPTLKRWEDGLDKVLSNGASEAEESFTIKEMINGHHKIEVEDILKDDTFDLDYDPPDIPTSSTPKLIDIKGSFPKLDDDSLVDDVPYLASSKSLDLEPTIVKQQVKGTVSVSIPVIKPDLTHYDKLPSPPPASTHPSVDQSWRISSTSKEENRPTLERLSIQSLYSPIFGKPEKLVNGSVETSEISVAASELYSTAVMENSVDCSNDSNSSSTTTNSSSVLSVTVANKSSSPSGAAGFAKTLIVPGAGPSEVENLLRLATAGDAPTLEITPTLDVTPTLEITPNPVAETAEST